MERNYQRPVTDEDRRDFLKALGLGGAVAVGATIPELRDAVTVQSSGELAERGQAIRSDVTGTIDTGLLTEAMAGVEQSISQLPAVYREGVPGRNEALYSELATSGWEIDSHLADVGFYAAAEAYLPRFTSGHIETVLRQLIHTESLAAALDAVEFEDHEQTDLVVSVVAQADELAVWYPTWFLEEGGFDDVNPEYVPPLQRRATAGSLDWISGLDKFLWQNEVLITDEMLEVGMYDIRTMLAGVYLMATAAERFAAEAITDAELTALISGSSAIAIAGQTALVNNVVRINDAKRAPPTRRDALNSKL